MTTCMQHPYWKRDSGNPQRTMPLVRKITFKKLSKCYSNNFKKHWNDDGQLCLKVILHIGLTEHYIFFVTRNRAFFSSNVFVISILVFFLIRRQSSKLTLETKWYHSCGCCDDSRSCEQLKKRVNDKHFKKRYTSNHLRYRTLPLQ